jgi:predicted nucleic acid-binding protein
MRFLVDTNVISEVGKGQGCDRNVAAWYRSVELGSVCLSVLVIGELRAGIERVRRRDPDRAAHLDRSLVLTADMFADRIFGIDRRVAETWGRLNAERRVPAVDALIAATALVHGMVVVTRNIRDFAATGVQLLNPFEPPSRGS